MALHLPFSSLETLTVLRVSSRPLLSPPPSNSHILSSTAARSYAKIVSLRLQRRRRPLVVSVGMEETEIRVSSSVEQQDPNPEDVEFVRQIQRVLELLSKNRDMTFGEVKLTIMIEDPRDTERKILLGIEDPDEVTRDDLAAALEDIHEGRIPENRVALRLLAEEMIQWPDLEVETTKKKGAKSRTKSPYAKATDTGIDPEVAAKRLNVDWDSAADIELEDENDDIEVPPAVGFGALYLVTALPILIGVSVVLILFYNSLQ